MTVLIPAIAFAVLVWFGAYTFPRSFNSGFWWFMTTGTFAWFLTALVVTS